MALPETTPHLQRVYAYWDRLLYLRYGENMPDPETHAIAPIRTYPEIGRLVGRHRGTVLQQIGRARAHLRILWTAQSLGQPLSPAAQAFWRRWRRLLG